MTSPVSAIEAIEKFGPDADWDAGAHVRLLRANGGPSSGYTADLIQNLHCTVVALARQAEALQRENAEKDERIALLRESLLGFEHACEQLAATRTHEIYTAMIDGGQAQELLELDNARRRARALLGGENAE